MILKDKV